MVVRRIDLTKGQFALVSDEDYAELGQFKWYAMWCSDIRSYYAARNCAGGGTVLMHRQLLGLEKGDRRQGDHVNGNTLDNSRSNLRIATSSQNNQNKRRSSRSRSGFKGVSWHGHSRKWRAHIQLCGRQVSLGYYSAPELAHAAYCDAATKHYGEFARTA